MSSSRGGVLGITCLACLVPGLAAQTRAEFEARLRRAERLQDSLGQIDRAAKRSIMERAATGRSGPVIVVLRGDEPAVMVAESVWSAFRSFGGFTAPDIARFVLVEDGVADAGDRVHDRRVVTFGRPGGLVVGADPVRFATLMADNAIWSLSGALLKDSVTGQWLQRRFDPRVTAEREKLAAAYELVEGRWPATRGCLGGTAADCVIYLGIEERPDIRRRYPIARIRALLRSQRAIETGNPQQRCLGGSDEACAAFWGDPGPPAGWNARWTLVAFARERYGAGVLRGLLVDSAATIGLRFQHATGQPVEALARQWREWVLATARSTPVSAGLTEITFSMMASLVLLALAARSGRWRA